MLFKEWLTDWLKTCVKPSMKDRTVIKYEGIVNSKIVPCLGEYELCELEATLLQRFISDMIAKYSASTVEGIMTALKSSLRTAVKMGVTDRQFSDCLVGPKIEEKPIECFKKEEQKKIENYVKNKKKDKLIGILLCLYTGIRIGELFALTWDDIDLKNEYFVVKKSCHDAWGKQGYHKVIESPKTRTSKRAIPLPKQLMPYMTALKKNSTSEFVIYGRSKAISIRSYQRTFERILQELNIPHKGFHALRHTFATRAIECGMDVKTLSEILGHKNPMITLSRYAHSLMEHKSEMMNKVGSLLK